jgi:hypothetical protein
METNDPVLNVTDITVKGLVSDKALLITLPYVSSAMQSTDQAHPGHTYALTIPQCQFLAQKISELLHAVETSASQKNPLH